MKVMDINRASLSEQVFQLLVSRITDLSIKPGERMKPSKLSAELNISSAPIREALHRLVQEKLVVIKPRIGYFVVKMTEGEITDLFDIRKMLETHAIREAINDIPSIKIADLQSRLLSLRNEDTDFNNLKKQFDEIDAILHNELIVSYAKNKYIKDFYFKIANFSAIVRHIDLRFSEDIEEHLQILDKISDRNTVQAEAELILHLNNAKRSTLARLKEYGKPNETE